MRKNSRSFEKIRPVQIFPDYCPAAMGSVLIQMGETKVICATSISTDVPPHAQGRMEGWISAEYSLLPYSTNPRTKREILRRDGRSVEIQRLIGRSLRSLVDLAKIAGHAIIVDCDVLQADGGTRTAAITGGFIALKRTFQRMVKEGLIEQMPVTKHMAAISVGIVDGIAMVDLDYSEDSRAEVDLNVVMDEDGNIIEIQGTGEGRPFSKIELDEMLNLASMGIEEMLPVVKRYTT
ncbi:MAG: ribonuclease PH [Spirochaetes bacterium]|nr:ribonuclease PH [Spirochaetota bacterium]